MNDYDRENLNFLLNADPETLEEWYEFVSEDDHTYAAELLEQYKKELTIRQSLITIENINIDNLLPDAEECLKKFMLGKK